jgi:hypothetical protein
METRPVEQPLVERKNKSINTVKANAKRMSVYMLAFR